MNDICESVKEITVNDFPKMRREYDLISDECFAWLTLLRDPAGEPWLLYWFDLERNVNRWWLLPTTEALVDAYAGRQIGLRRLLSHGTTRQSYQVDTDYRMTAQRAWEVPPGATIDQDGLPENDALHCANLENRAPNLPGDYFAR